MSDVFDGRRGRRLGTEPASPCPEESMEERVTLAARIQRIEHQIIAILGLDGGNGKLGTLRRDFEADKGTRNKIIAAIGTAAAGALITGILSVYAAGQRAGARDSEMAAMRDEITSLRQREAERERDLAVVRAELRDLRRSIRFPSASSPASGDQP